MKYKLSFLYCIIAFTLLSCHKDNDTPVTAKHTIVAYMMVDGLDSYIKENIKDMITISKELPAYENILTFLDYSGKESYILKITQGKVDTVMNYRTNLINSDPEVMADVLQWCYTNYPADNYGLVIGSHGSSWMFSNDTIPVKDKKTAIGIRYGNDKAINIPTLAKVLKQVPHQQFILFDLCAAQSIETAYEIKSSTDYIIASAAEIPDSGAQFKVILPYMLKDNPVEIGRQYYEYYAKKNPDTKPPISVVKTAEIDNLAQKTKQFLHNIADEFPANISLYGLIYYFTTNIGGYETPICYDMNNIMLKFLPEDDYKAWKAQFDNVVVYKGKSSNWMTVYPIDFNSFNVTDDTFGGVSMFVPSTKYSSSSLNADYEKTMWYNAVYK